MSRSGYSDDCEFLELYRASVDRASSGKRGQVFFRDLATALDAMPVKRLISDELRTGDGAVCALGALGIQRGTRLEALDPHDRDQVGKAFNIAPSLAAEVVYENDDRGGRETPEERWTRMRAWVAENIQPASACHATSGKETK